jgi:acyl CoA:acetate/3-ketoacid CoA transferase beta subunit
MLGDASMVLGALVAGPSTRVIGCLGGAQIDQFGNINSTTLQPDGPFLVGSGGGNDVASTAEECIVVATLAPARTPPRCAYVTSPGRAVKALVTDLGTFEKRDRDVLGLVAVPEGDGTVDERVDAARRACGWDVEVLSPVEELPPPTMAEVEALRRWDPRGWFLRAR